MGVRRVALGWPTLSRTEGGGARLGEERGRQQLDGDDNTSFFLTANLEPSRDVQQRTRTTNSVTATTLRESPARCTSVLDHPPPPGVPSDSHSPRSRPLARPPLPRDLVSARSHACLQKEYWGESPGGPTSWEPERPRNEDSLERHPLAAPVDALQARYALPGWLAGQTEGSSLLLGLQTFYFDPSRLSRRLARGTGSVPIRRTARHVRSARSVSWSSAFDGLFPMQKQGHSMRIWP